MHLNALETLTLNEVLSPESGFVPQVSMKHMHDVFQQLKALATTVPVVGSGGLTYRENRPSISLYMNVGWTLYKFCAMLKEVLQREGLCPFPSLWPKQHVVEM